MASTQAQSGDSASMSTLNAQLIFHGWAKRPLNLDALAAKEYNEVVAVLFELLGSSATNVETLDSLSARHRTLQYENERILKALGAATTVQGRMELDVAGWKARCTEVERRLALEESKNKELREEIGRGRKALDGVRVAASHEAKKIQSKLDGAQAKLAKISSDASIASKPQGLYLCNPIPSNRSVPSAVGQAPLLEQSLRDLAEVREGLQDESEAFRHVIVSTANGLRDILAFAEGQDTPPRLLHASFFSEGTAKRATGAGRSSGNHKSPPSITHPSIADSKLRALLASVRSRVQERIVHVLPPDAVGETPEEVEEKKRAEREVEKRKMDLEDRVKDLEVEVVLARGKEEEAKKAMEEFAKAQIQAGCASTSRAVHTADSRPSRKSIPEDTEEVDVMDLAMKKHAVEEEKRKMVEAMLRLNRERQQFERERQEFEAERRKADVEAMLAFLPSSPSAGSSESTSPEGVPASPWQAPHRPLSPSPLSPMHPRNRTPKAHLASAKKRKTPLARLVLEKAVRVKMKETVVVDGAVGEVLGESSKTNASPTRSVGGSGKGKSRLLGADALGKGAPPDARLRASVKVDKKLSASTGAPGVTERKKVDLSKSTGVGPGAAKAARPWR